MYKVRVFKTDKGRAVYAVTGFTFTGTKGSMELAIAEVARYKKESVKTAKARYNAKQGLIVPYKDGLDGLYYAGEIKSMNAEPCIMVWKGQLV